MPAETALSRRALFGAGLTGALQGRFDAAAATAPRRSTAARTAGEGEADRLGPALLPAAERLLAPALAGEGRRRVLVLGAGDGTPLVALALARDHAVTAVERDAALRERGAERLHAASWHAAAPPGERFDAALGWFGATYDPEPRRVAATLCAAALPGAAIALVAWTPAAMARLRGDTPRSHQRPEQWSRYETAYRHFFDLPELDVVQARVDALGLDFAVVTARMA